MNRAIRHVDHTGQRHREVTGKQLTSEQLAQKGAKREHAGSDCSLKMCKFSRPLQLAFDCDAQARKLDGRVVRDG